MKQKVLRKLATARQWANTEHGERMIVKTLTALMYIGIADIVILAIGFITS